MDVPLGGYDDDTRDLERLLNGHEPEQNSSHFKAAGVIEYLKCVCSAMEMSPLSILFVV